SYDEDYLLAIFLEFGLRRRRPAIYGRWSGRATPGQSFQDINILENDPTVEAVNAAGRGRRNFDECPTKGFFRLPQPPRSASGRHRDFQPRPVSGAKGTARAAR